MQSVLDALEPLENESRRRVLAWATDRLKSDASRTAPVKPTLVPPLGPTASHEGELVPWTEVGGLLGGVKRTKLAELIADGELPSVKIGRRRFVSRTAIAEYVRRLTA